MIRKYDHPIRYLMVSLALTLMLTGCGKGCLKKGGVEEASLALIPADNNIVVGVNWKKIFASPFGEKLKASIPPEAAPLLQDIDGVVIGMSVKNMDKNTADFVGVVSGKLDPPKVIAQLTEQATKNGATLETETYEGVQLYSSSKDPQFAVAFVENKGIFGGKQSLKKSIDLSKKKGDSIEKNQAVLDLIHSIDQSKMLWAVGAIPPGMVPAGQGGGPMGALANLKAIDLAVDYSDQLLANLGVTAANKENAQQLTTMVNSYKTLFGTSLAMKDPNMGKLINGLTIEAKNDRVNLNLKLDKATVEELANKAKEKQAAEKPAGAVPPETVPSGVVQ